MMLNIFKTLLILVNLQTVIYAQEKEQTPQQGFFQKFKEKLIPDFLKKKKDPVPQKIPDSPEITINNHLNQQINKVLGKNLQEYKNNTHSDENFFTQTLCLAYDTNILRKLDNIRDNMLSNINNLLKYKKIPELTAKQVHLENLFYHTLSYKINQKQTSLDNFKNNLIKLYIFLIKHCNLMDTEQNYEKIKNMEIQNDLKSIPQDKTLNLYSLVRDLINQIVSYAAKILQ